MKKVIIIKAIGILTICLVTFLNVNIGVDKKSDQSLLTLASLNVPTAQAEAGIGDGGWFCCLGWGVPCSCWQQPEQKQRCSYCW